MLDTLIKNGFVVTPEGEGLLNVGILNGKIVWIASTDVSAPQAGREIDAKGCLVFPGGIEAHAHIKEPMHKGWTKGEEVWLPDPDVVSKAAIFGGTTTIASFAFMDVHTTKKEFDANVAIEDRKAVFSGNSFADFVFHPVITGHPTEQTIDSLKSAIKDGTSTFKVFTTDVTSAQTGVKISDGSLMEVMQVLGENGALLFAHAESDELVKHMESRLAQIGQDQWYNLHLVHTNLSEELAFHKVIRMAKEASLPVLFAHVTGIGGVSEIAKAKADGQEVYGEVLHNYLAYTAEDYKKVDGGKYQTYPALKSKADQDALWEALSKDVISLVSTDEYTTNYQIKTQGKTLSTACGGHAGIETRGIYLFSEGYRKNRLSLRQFVNAFSSSPARILGMYPQKGAIQIGSDADIVIWDPEINKQIKLTDLHHGSDYSIWEGWNIEGWPILTMLRGKVVVEGSNLLGNVTDGMFIPRKY